MPLPAVPSGFRAVSLFATRTSYRGAERGRRLDAHLVGKISIAAVAATLMDYPLRAAWVTAACMGVVR